MCGLWSSEAAHSQTFLLVPGMSQQKPFFPQGLLLCLSVSYFSHRSFLALLFQRYPAFSSPSTVTPIIDLAKDPYKCSGKLGSSGLEGPISVQ